MSADSIAGNPALYPYMGYRLCPTRKETQC
nr:MAG TPA_asm: hypothetical protein [Caudoviricetes sp.]